MNERRLDRQKVLAHHPDKQTAEAQQSEGDDLFKCIKIGTAKFNVWCVVDSIVEWNSFVKDHSHGTAA